MFVGKARSLPSSRAPEMEVTWGSTGLFQEALDMAWRLATSKLSCLSRKFVDDGRKTFYNLGPMWKWLAVINTLVYTTTIVKVLLYRPLGATTITIEGFYVTLSSIGDTQHNNALCWLSVIKLSVAFYLYSCWMSLCSMSLYWVSLYSMSLCWVSWRHPPFGCQMHKKLKIFEENLW